jgi:prepilin-type processing-associated H-X9-DG protein
MTIVELLAALGVVAVLVGVTFTGLKTVIRKGDQAKETSAARKLIVAYVTAAGENDGVLPPGYDRAATDVHQRDGRLVSGPAAHRYPWRMLPYLGGSVTDTLYVSRNRTMVDLGDEYMVSLYPAFGMNYVFVGGDGQRDGSISFPSDCAQRLAQVSQPSKLLVFASSRAKGNGKGVIEGYSILTPPNLTGRMWSPDEKYDEKSSPERYGHLDLRFSSNAVCAFLDGHVALLGLRELSDMRNWSARAAELDDPNYKVTAPNTGGRR